MPEIGRVILWYVKNISGFEFRVINHPESGKFESEG